MDEQPAILVVEDDTDIREMMATLFGMSGFEVFPCESAECGLKALREREFDLILTDYALPRKSGLWLLEEAKTEGLIDDTPVLIVTAHPNVNDQAPYEVIQKPFDLDELIERVRHRMDGADSREPRRPRHAMPLEGGDRLRGRSPECSAPIELILYVGSQSARSFAAVSQIKKALKRFSPSWVRLTVCDLSLPQVQSRSDLKALTPASTSAPRTLCPRTFILGHSTNRELLLELLADCSDPN
jgi:CheY-like chemotaxis protein